MTFSFEKKWRKYRTKNWKNYQVFKDTKKSNFFFSMRLVKKRVRWKVMIFYHSAKSNAIWKPNENAKTWAKFIESQKNGILTVWNGKLVA